MTDHRTTAGTVVAVASGNGGADETGGTAGRSGPDDANGPTPAVELGAALADRGEATVVVDCDLDAPILDDRAGFPPDDGESLPPDVTLSDALGGAATVGDATVGDATVGDTAVDDDPAPRSTVGDATVGDATVGEATGDEPTATDRLVTAVGDPRLDEYAGLDRLRAEFDAVVLDASSDFETAESVLPLADAVVVATTPEPPAVARRTTDLLARFDGRVLGGAVVGADAGTDGRTDEAVAQLGDEAETVVAVPAGESRADGESAPPDRTTPDRTAPDRPAVEAAPDGDAAAAYRRLAGAVADYDPPTDESSAGATPGGAAVGDAAVGEAAVGDPTSGGRTADDVTGDSAESARRVAGIGGSEGLLSALVDRFRGGDDRPPSVAYHPDRGLSVSRRAVVAAVVAVQVALVALVVADPPVPLVRPVLGGAYGLFLPGLLVALLLDLDRCSFTRTLAYSVGLSAVVLLAVGAVMSLAYPVAGVDDPIREGPVHATLLFVVFGLCAAVLAREQDRPLRIPIQGSFSPTPLALLVVPFVSVFGITFQNLTGNNAVLLALLVGLSVLPVVSARDRLPSRWLPLAVWAIAAALLYHNSLFGPSIGGPSGASETLDVGTWNPDEESVLPNGVLFPLYVLLTDLRLGIEVSTLNPLLVSFIPVVLFEGYREQVGDRVAFSSACLFMFSFPFYVLYPSAGRVATPVFFLALEGLVLCDPDVRQVNRHVLGILFGMGLAVSHYGTAYVALVAFVLALLTYVALKATDVVRTLGRPVLRRDRLTAAVARVRRHRPTLLSWSFVGFYVVFVLEWYFYTSGGEKFAILPRKVISVVGRFFEASASGTAAAAVSKDYGSTTVALSRRFYIVIGALMGIGIAATVFARVVRRESVEIDDEFLALGVGLMSMLGASFFVVGFNVARIMMIVFTFTAVYVVFGAGSIVEAVLTARRALVAAVARERRAVAERLAGFEFDRALDGARTELTGVSVLLCAFLLLNAGVVTVFVTHDYAPSNIVTQQQLQQSEEVQVQLKAKGCVDCDIESHVWLFAHRNRSKYAYGDYQAWAQVDFYRGSLSGRLSYYPKKVTYRSLWDATNGTEDRALVLLLDHNLDTGVMLVESNYYWKSLAYLDPVRNRSHVVYTTGETRIFRSTGRATERALDFRRPEPTDAPDPDLWGPDRATVPDPDNRTGGPFPRPATDRPSAGVAGPSPGPPTGGERDAGDADEGNATTDADEDNATAADAGEDNATAADADAESGASEPLAVTVERDRAASRPPGRHVAEANRPQAEGNL